MPIFAALLPTILGLIPQLTAIFKPGSEVATRNVAAATAVAETLIKATEAVNLQDAVEKMESNPDAKAAAVQAIQDNWYALVEIGGGVKAAREASIVMQNAERTFLRNPAFWVSVLLLIMPYMLLIDVFYVHPTIYEGATRTQIVTGILAVIMMVGGFWIGSSLSSQSKDATIDRAVK